MSRYRNGDLAAKVRQSASTVRRWENRDRVTVGQPMTRQRCFEGPDVRIELYSSFGMFLSPQQELVEDLLPIVYIFSRSVYGLRRFERQLKPELKGCRSV